MQAKNKIVFCGRTILSLALLFYLTTILDWERIKYILPKLHLEFIWQAFFLVLLSILCMATRWSLLLKQLNVGQGIFESWRYYIISMFYGIILPGVIGGDVVRLSLSITKHGMDKRTIITASVIFERVCGFMVILLIASVTALLVPSLLRSEQAITNLIYASSLSTIICFALFFGILKVGPKRWFSSKKFQYRLIHSTHLLLGKFRNLSVKALSSILILSFLAHLLDIIGSYFLARALHIDLSFFLFLVIIPLVYVLTALPISLAGLGVREGVLTFLLMKVGVIASDAVLFAFLIYLNRITVALIGGFIQFMNKKLQPLDSHESLP